MNKALPVQTNGLTKLKQDIIQQVIVTESRIEDFLEYIKFLVSTLNLLNSGRLRPFEIW